MKMNVRTIRVILIGLLGLAVVTAGLWATRPTMAGPTAQEDTTTSIPYQGRLTGDDGQPVADGAYDFTLEIYDVQSGGTLLWTETQTGIAVRDGYFSVLLGSLNPLGAEAASGEHYLAVSVQGPGDSGLTALDPRQSLDSLMLSPQQATCGVGAITQDHWGETWSGSGTGLILESSNGYGFIARTNSTADYYAAVRGSALGTAGANYGVYGSTDSTAGYSRGVYGYASAGGVGVWGESPDGPGTRGRSTNNYGVWGKSDYGHGVFGETMTASGSSYGVYGKSYSTAGGGGVRGYATGTSGVTIGVYGRTDSSTNSARGVLGWATATTGVTEGVRGQTASSTDSARGVWGYATATSGETYGVYGTSNSLGGYGVYGTNTAGGYAGGFDGRVSVDADNSGYGLFVDNDGTGDGIRVYADATSSNYAALWAENDGAGTGVYGSGGIGVYGSGGTDSSSNRGGYFTGYHGIRAEATGAYGSGGYFESTNGHGIYIGSAGKSGIEMGTAGNDGIYIYSAGWNGIFIAGAGSDGVFANTNAANQEWGFNTPDKIYAGTTLASGGPLMFVAQNGGTGELEPGDVVAAAGLGAPFAESPVFITLVRRADPASSAAVVGVVYRRFVAKEVEEIEHEGQVERYTKFETHSAEGPIAPGEYMLIVVLGTCEVKVDATSGAISPGDPLTLSSTQGRAARAQQLTLDGVSFYPPGVTFGTALATLDKGTDTIPVFVTLQ